MAALAKALTNKAVTWATEMLIRSRYELWIRKFGRTYADAAEKERRFEIFKERFEFVTKHNRARTYGCTLGLDEFADMSMVEFGNTYCVDRADLDHQMSKEAGRKMPRPKAAAGAWRTKGRSQQRSPPQRRSKGC